jgi:uridine kinase
VTTDAAQIVDLALARPALLGTSRLVCVDGPAGSGKTTTADLLAAELARRGRSVSLVHMDDVYEGWTGLATAGDRVRRRIVEPLARGEAAGHPRYDWHRGEYAEVLTVAPADVLVVEGVGSGHLGYADRISLLVFVEAPEATRLRRGIARDGAQLQEEWVRWMVQESDLHEAEQTRSRADVVVDGETGQLIRTSRRSRPASSPP